MELLVVGLIMVAGLHNSSATAQAAFYSCGEDYHPADLTFAPDGTLYSTDLGSYYKQRSIEDSFFNSYDLNSDGNVYKHDEQGCIAIAEDWTRPFGITTLADGRICANHMVRSERIAPESGESDIFVPTISCWNGEAWTMDLDQNTQRMFTYVSTGIEATSKGLFFPTGTGIFRLSEAEVEQVSEGVNLLPLFLEKVNDQLWAMTFSFVDPEWGNSVDPTMAIFPSDGYGVSIAIEEGYATGVVTIANHLWMAHFESGELRKFSVEGKLLASYGGFRGPMGLEQAPNGNLCVAELLAKQISCLDIETLKNSSAKY